MSRYEPLMRFENVEVRYGNTVALEDISFTVEKPSFTAIVGPNGAGKTTLLKTALGLIKPSRGSVIVLGIDVLKDPWRVRRLVGYVPQRERIDHAMPALVRDIVLMGRALRLKVGASLSEKDHEIARSALSKVGLLDMWDEPFSHLSGGQQQRVMIARALAAEPKLLLLDEPLSGVDAESQVIIVRLLREMADNGIGVFVVVHDLNPFIRHLDYILLLNKRVIGFGKPVEVTKPEILSLTFNREVKVLETADTYFILGTDTHA